MEIIKGSREIYGLHWNIKKFNYLSRLIVVLTALCSQIQGYSSHVNLRIEESTDDRGESLPLLKNITIDVQNYTTANYLQSKLKLSDYGDYLHGHSSDPWSSADTLLSEAIGKSTSTRRSKRSVVHLFNMVVCATGCNPLIYKGYGCYCGFLGSGYPVDGIDRCCWMHDRCYDASGCPTFSEYFIPYYWKCYRGYQPICAVTHGSWGGSGSCAQRLCECDRALAMCLKRFRCPSSKAVCTSSPFRLVQNIFMIF